MAVVEKEMKRAQKHIGAKEETWNKWNKYTKTILNTQSQMCLKHTTVLAPIDKQNWRFTYLFACESVRNSVTPLFELQWPLLFLQLAHGMSLSHLTRLSRHQSQALETWLRFGRDTTDVDPVVPLLSLSLSLSLSFTTLGDCADVEKVVNIMWLVRVVLLIRCLIYSDP